MLVTGVQSDKISLRSGSLFFLLMILILLLIAAPRCDQMGRIRIKIKIMSRRVTGAICP